MKIGFDAKRAFNNVSGLGNYSRSLITSLCDHAASDEYHLYTTRDKGGDFSQEIRQKKNALIHLPDTLIDRRLKARWRSYVITRLLQRDGIQLYHGLSNELPFNIARFKGKKVVTVHDLIFIRHPELYPYLDRKIYNKKCRHACHVADVVVAVSEQTKRDLEELYFLPDSRIQVIYQSGDPSFYEPVSDIQKKAVRDKYKLPADYILNVGTIEDRKNLISVVRTLEHTEGVSLVVIGRKKGHFKQVAEFIEAGKLEKRVLFLEDVPQEDLPAIYSLAQLFVYPSLIEGFGIPLIEALCSGTPVITSKGGCFPEAAGPGSVYVNPEDQEEITAQVKALLSDSGQRARMSKTGKEYVQRFHPKLAATLMSKLYHSL